jgi:hypothetical protein
MNKKNLVSILNKEITILADFIESFDKNGNVHPVEIDLTLSKVKDIYNELLLLKGEGAKNDLDKRAEQKTTIKYESDKESQQSNNNFVHTDEKNESENTIKEENIFEVIPEKDDTAVNNIEEQHPEEAEIKPEIDTTANKPQENSEIKEKEELQQNIKNTEEKDILQKEITTEPGVTQDNLTSKNNEKELVEEKQQQPAKKKQIIADTFANKTLSINDMMARAKSNKDLASSLKNGPVKDLTKEIKLNDRIWYINELFGKNATTYEKTVNVVNAADNLDEALEYLFSNFKWDQNRKSTISFLELVFRRFA